MNTTLLLFVSWLSLNLNIVCGLILILLSISAIVCLIYLTEKDVNPYVFFILGVIGFALLLCSIPFFMGSSAEIEKIEYEHHEYLIYKGHTFYHNPDCPCRKLLLSTKKDR